MLCGELAWRRGRAQRRRHCVPCVAIACVKYSKYEEQEQHRVWDGYRKLAVCTRAQVYVHCSSRACICQAPWAGQKTSSCVCAGGAGAVCAAECCRQAGMREGGWLGGWEGACIYPEVGSWYWMLAGCPVRWRRRAGRQARSLTSTASARPPATAAPGGMWAAQPTGAFNVFCGATGAASPPTAATPIAQHLAAKVTAAAAAVMLPLPEPA